MKTELYRRFRAIRSLLQVLLMASVTGSWAEKGHKTDKNVQTLQIPSPTSNVAVRFKPVVSGTGSPQNHTSQETSGTNQRPISC